jgi:hypothetical protein
MSGQLHDLAALISEEKSLSVQWIGYYCITPKLTWMLFGRKCAEDSVMLKFGCSGYNKATTLIPSSDNDIH